MIATGARGRAFRLPLLVALSFAAAFPASAALELENATRYRLDNGLTVILLVDRNFPVASVQMLYKVGARNEVTGKTGLAHFLEHMAFRATKNFPDTEVVSRIYARGGEWHGYTWTDQTVYFSTVPKDDIDLLLEIEADRMANVVIDPEVIAAEQGAVLAEMHMYENWPSSMLLDALAFTSFQAHPYRNNTIGWESDIENITRDDVVQFYRSHYNPANAVLSIVGDFDADKVRQRVETLFGSIAAGKATPPPHTIEPVQQGERRIGVSGTTPGRRFMMGWRAPAVSHPDFAAFLVMQQLLAGSSGVSFLQNDWGTPASENSVLFGAADNITSWFPPSAQDYLFVVGGVAGDGSSEQQVEAAIDARIAAFRDSEPTLRQIDVAVAAIRDELVFDVQTTEDAAHQLGFFEGLGAYEVLLTLPARLAAVRPADVARVARQYLAPGKRTIAWYRPGVPQDVEAAITRQPPSPPLPEPGPIDDRPADKALQQQLRGGVPVLIRRSDLAQSFELRIVAPGNASSSEDFLAGDPEPGLLSFNVRGTTSTFRARAEVARDALAAAVHEKAGTNEPSVDPETRLYDEFVSLMAPWSPPPGEPLQAAVIALAGDVDVRAATAVLDDLFGAQQAALLPKIERAAIPAGRRDVRLGVPVAQSQLGYIAAAPGPRDDGYLATRILLYIFAHGYEGRFGKEAISRRGLAYYVDARYRSAGGPGYITLGVGVDTPKIDALATLLADELARLESQPPTAAEIEEAKQHLVGRALSAAQGNDELALELARHFIWHGESPSAESLSRQLAAVTRDDVLAAIPAFVSGLTIRVVP